MNKIAAYLNEHINGEVTSAKAMRKRFSRDGSVLTVLPELVVFARTTTDIRKLARFAWQLAEKGHPLSVTVRGNGGDATGAAIGKGVIVDTSRHLHHVLQFAVKERQVHVQPGITSRELHQVLKWHGQKLAGSPEDDARSTIGGLLANNSLGSNIGIARSIEKMEVVLANGDVIEVGRLSRKEVDKKLGLQTFEGEIYRKLEGLIEDNEAVIAKLAKDPTRDNTGYKPISVVRAKDGSFDLTPLFIGSQGTLGIISEVVFRTDFYGSTVTHAIIPVDSREAARDVSEHLMDLEPAALRIYDGDLFRRAAETGVTFDLLGSVEDLHHLIMISFDDFNERNHANKMKKLTKIARKMDLTVIDSTDRQNTDFDIIRQIGTSLSITDDDHTATTPIIDGSFVSATRREDFFAQLDALTEKHHIKLPTIVNVMTGIIDGYPQFRLETVGDKQKLVRLIAEYADLVDRCGGAFVSDGGEGRLKSLAAWATLDDEDSALYEQVRTIFDPFNTMNAGVKQRIDVRTLAGMLRSSYDQTDQV